jgi:hypothetical protein
VVYLNRSFFVLQKIKKPESHRQRKLTGFVPNKWSESNIKGICIVTVVQCPYALKNMNNIEAENLIQLWMLNSIGTKEDFDVMIIDFLETLNEHISISEVLQDAVTIASSRVVQFPEDVALQLSFKAFNRSLEYHLQFWKNMINV